MKLQSAITSISTIQACVTLKMLPVMILKSILSQLHHVVNRDREIERQRDIETERQRDRETERQRDRESM